MPGLYFKYARLGRDLRFANLETAFDWLASAGIAIEAMRVPHAARFHRVGVTQNRRALCLANRSACEQEPSTEL